MTQITFADLFCGIGGFRLALNNNGFKCVFSGEINPHACLMYKENFGDNPYCDISKFNPEEIPDFNILCAGFPCQAFSIAGNKNGFNDTRGTLFFDLCRIIDIKKPDVLLLENVKNLLNHDNGNTFNVIKTNLDNLGYNVFYEVLNAIDFNIPQNRERIILVCLKRKSTLLKSNNFDFSLINKNKNIHLNSILEKENFVFLNPNEYTLIDNPKTQKSGLIFSGYRNKKQRINGVKDNTQHLSRSHKQPNRIYDSNGTHPTLSSQESSGRYFILIDNKVRKLTLLECYRLMGFPDSFIKSGSQTNLYNRIGNSVCIPMIDSVANAIKIQLL